MTAAKQLTCEVVYATPQRQWVVPVTLAEGATVGDAVLASGLCETCPELAGPTLVLGVFGAVVAAERKLREGERVEIYRPLLVDPREARRARAVRKSR